MRCRFAKLFPLLASLELYVDELALRTFENCGVACQKKLVLVNSVFHIKSYGHAVKCKKAINPHVAKLATL